MAAGETLLILTPHMADIPTSVAANPGAEKIGDQPVLQFNATTDGTVDFPILLPRNYAGGGIDVIVHWSGNTAIIGEVVLALAFERHQAGVTNLNIDSFAAAQTVVATTNLVTAGIPTASLIPFTDGAQIDGIVPGDPGRVRLQRLGLSDVLDNMAGFADWRRIEIRETP